MSWIVHLGILVFFIASGTTTLASEPLAIRKIIEDPQKYQLHLVTLTGIARSVQTFEEPYSSGGELACYGAYTFMLEDKTGSLEVVVPGVCGRGKTAPPPVSEGERVRLDAVIQAPGHYGGDGLPPVVFLINPAQSF